MTPDIKKRLQLIQCQKVPKGYFKAGNWIIPKDWKIKIGNDLFSYIRNGFVGTVTPYYVSNGVRYLQGTNIKNGKIVSNEVFFVNEDFHKKHPNSQLRLNDIVVVQSGAVGECAIVNSEYAGGNCHALIIMTPREDINVAWFSNFMNSPYRRKMLAGVVTGNTIHHILASDMKKIVIPTPTIKEQNKIAEIFSLQDQIIEYKESLVKEKQRQKKYLMQQLLTGKIRLPHFTDKWKREPLGAYLIEEKEIASPDIQLRITVKLNLNGVERRVPSATEREDATVQYLRRAGQFIYGKQNLFKGALGIVPNDLDGFQSSSDIPSFTVLHGLLAQWVFYWFSRESYYKNLEKIASGTGSKRIQTETFLALNILVPPIKEQRAIVECLSLVDKELELLQLDIEQEKQKKKALMQLLLMGIVRVKE